MWLCEEESNGGSAGHSSVTGRAKKWKKGEGREGDMDWVRSYHLSPSGRVELDTPTLPVHRSPKITGSKHALSIDLPSRSSPLGNER